MRNPLLLPLVGIAAGIALDRLAPFRIWDAGLAALALAALATVAGARRSRGVAYAALIPAFIFAGASLAAMHRPSPPPALNAESGETVLLAGCVVEPPSIRDDREQAVLELAPGARVRLTLKGDPLRLRYGQQIEVAARIRYPRNFRNPGSFDYTGWLARRQIYWTASAEAESVKPLSGDCGSPVRASLFGLRTAALDRIAQLYQGDEYKTAMLQALLIGDSTRVEKLWTEHFRRTGTYHALVISGLHISLLAGTVLTLSRLCYVPMAVALAVSGALAWLYALVSGGEAPVARAAAGFTLYLIARFFFRRGRILNLLAGVALIFLAADPEQMFEASFQLSFLAVAAIGALAAPLIERTSAVWLRAARSLHDATRDVHLERAPAAVRVELRLIAETIALALRISEAHAARFVTAAVRCAVFLFDSLVVSLAVQFGLALPMIVYFHRLSVSGISANLIVVPLLNGAVLLGFAAIFTGSGALAWAAGLLLDWSRRVVDWHASWEPQWRIPDPPLWLAAAFVASLLLAAFASRHRQASFALSLALLAGCCVYPGGQSERAVLELTAIDVGQGDSLLVSFPDGRRMLVDGGGFPVFGKGKRKPGLDTGEDVVSPYLWSRGIRRLDVVVSTHGHEDHAGGLPAIIRNFGPNEVWAGASPPVPGLAARSLRAGARFEFGRAAVRVLSPAQSYVPGERAGNNDSLVLLVSYGKHRFLLTGDMDREVEWELLEREKLPRVDVLKVPHHGSRSSSTDEFLEAIRPRIALLSVGADNLYALPHPAVTERLAGRRATVLRTDTLGLATVTSDGERLSFSAYEWENDRPARYSPF